MSALRYFVYAPNGQRYGPADLQTLQQWIGEGRVLPSSLVEQELSGERMAANTIPGLQFPANAPYGPSAPMGTQPGPSPYAGYHRPGMNTPSPMTMPGNNEITISWICGAVGISTVLGCGWFPFGGVAPIILGAVGMWQGAKARDLGHSQGQSAYIFSLVVLVLGILGLVACTGFVLLLPFFAAAA